MKQLILIGVTVGIASWAQAISINIQTGGSIDGNNSYEYLINSASGLTKGTQISTAWISFNNITLTSSGSYNSIFVDLINRNDATTIITGTGDTSTDYFKTHSPFSGTGVTDQLGKEPFPNTGVAQSWNFYFSGTALTDLQTDINNGYFDIGLDPNCHYTVGSISFNYTTPDQATTAVLLGMSFLGLMVFRRKLAFN